MTDHTGQGSEEACLVDSCTVHMPGRSDIDLGAFNSLLVSNEVKVRYGDTHIQ